MTAGRPLSESPLAGLTVVDFSRLFAGPLCTMTLADLGADVIKIESPAGDDARHFGPPFLGGEGMNFMALNRGKRSAVLDLKTDAGREAARRLTRRADIVVENFRPGVAERLGIGYEEVRARNEPVIHCSISGFGPAGEMSERPALDLILQAVSGVMARQADSEGTPQLLCVTIADTYAAAQAVQGILAALYVRERTGAGQRVEVSLLESILSSQAYRIICDPERLEFPGWDDTVPYQAFAADNGEWMAVAVVSPATWKALCTAIGRSELADDERFATNPLRVDNRDELIPILDAEFSKRSRPDWLQTLDAAGVPCAPIQELRELMTDPLMLKSGVLTELEHPTAGRVRTLGPGIRMSHTPASVGTPAPRLGEHTTEILESIGMESADTGDR
ncbi:MAG: CoA transferase [Solirubrobacterales bacterium]|nr:CoA transferase [Solirubrobacterales bacterium]